MDGDRVCSRDMVVKGVEDDRGDTREEHKIGVRGRLENARIHGKGRDNEDKIEDQGGQKSVEI